MDALTTLEQAVADQRQMEALCGLGEYTRDQIQQRVIEVYPEMRYSKDAIESLTDYSVNRYKSEGNLDFLGVSGQPKVITPDTIVEAVSGWFSGPKPEAPRIMLPGVAPKKSEIVFKPKKSQVLVDTETKKTNLNAWLVVGIAVAFMGYVTFSGKK